MKRVLKYLQDQGMSICACDVISKAPAAGLWCALAEVTHQAVAASQSQYSGSAYLSPNTKEPQQQARHHYKDQHNSHHQSRSEHPSCAAHSFPSYTAVGTALARPNGQRAVSGATQISEEVHRGITKHQYAQDNILQSYELYIPRVDHKHPNDPNGQKYWIIYIHGGYFRDPGVTSASFYPALDLLASGKHHQHHLNFKHGGGSPESADIRPHIAGYASLNYRLSPHLDKLPQDREKTPAYELRNAKWPEHMQDVLTAVAHLQGKYGFGERYLLVGHSIGATMALLSALAATKLPFSMAKGVQMSKIEPPMAILGVSGIYDFPLIHKTFPAYEQMTRNAIPDDGDDALASPAMYEAKDYTEAWTTGGKKRALIIAHSRDDSLVDWGQREEIEHNLKNAADIDVRLIEIKGTHNEIHEKGTELARVIVEAVSVMKGLEE